MPYCSTCGHKIQETDKFCDACGKDLQPIAQPTGKIPEPPKPKNEFPITSAPIQNHPTVPTNKSGGMSTGTKFLLVAVVVILAIAGVFYLTGGPSSLVGKESDIRVEDVRYTFGVNLTLGAYADVTYNLHNYGQAAGQVTVSFYGDKSGFVSSQTVIVPAQQSAVNQVTRVDISASDSSVDVRITNQTRIN